MLKQSHTVAYMMPKAAYYVQFQTSAWQGIIYRQAAGTVTAILLFKDDTMPSTLPTCKHEILGDSTSVMEAGYLFL